MATTIDSLELEIQSNSDLAANGLEKLAASLNTIKTSIRGGLGLSSIAKNIDVLNSSISSINGEGSSNLNKLSQSLQALSTCGKIKLSPAVANQISNIANATRSLSGVNFESLTSLATSLTPLSNLGKINLNGFISQIQQLPQAVKTLDSINMASFGNGVGQLATAIKPLTQLGRNNLTSFITQLSKIPDVLNKLSTANINDLTAKIQQLVNALSPLSSQMQKISNGFSAFPSKIKGVTQSTDRLVVSNNAASTSYVNLAAKIAIAVASLRTVVKTIGSWIHESNSYIENLNLFTVAMGSYADEAKKYAEHVGDIVGIDPGEWMRNQGIFMTMADGFGVASDRAYIMSKNLTQLGYDLSSFYNMPYGESMQKLQSGLAGELEPLRRLGYDLSVARLQQEAYTLGIDRKVSSMNQAEKAELRYYAIMTQVSAAQGDMARTLNAPANQLRILKSQVQQCARALGNIFIPALNAILPYAIAVAKVIRMVADIISGLSGFSLPEVDYSGVGSAVGGIVDDTDAISDGLSNATEKAKEFKNALTGIDELNVISQPENASGGNGGGSGGTGGGGLGFDLPTYDFLGGAVNSQVQEIVNKMKEWLGITGEINSWSDLFKTRLGKILIVIGSIGAAFLLWKISKAFSGAFGVIASLFGKGGKIGGKNSGFSIPSPKIILKGILDLTIIVLGVIALIEVVGLLMKIPGFEETAKNGIKALGIVFNGIGSIILPLTAVSIGIVALGKVGVPTVAKGLAGLAIIIGGTTGVILAVGALLSIPYFSDFLSTGINSVKSVFNGLYEIALPIGVLSAILIGLGIATPAVILSGLAGFALVIGGVSTVLVALGALNQIPGFSWIVGEGGKILIQIGEILGGFAGSIVKGFLTKVSESFPEIGSNLAGFMNNAQPFFKGLDAVNADSLKAVKMLAETVLILTAAGVLDGLSAWLTGGNSMVKFGKELNEFAPYLTEYCKQVEGIDGDSAEASAKAALTLANFAKEIPRMDGLVGFIMGNNDMAEFGRSLKSFGRDLAGYCKEVEGINADDVKASTDAALTLANFAKQIPNMGGMVAWFTGDNDMAAFGISLKSFGGDFAEYYQKIKGVKPDVITATSSSAQSLAKFASEIPNKGGVAAAFAGDNNIADFGEDLVSFGENFKKYYNSIYDIKPSIVSASSNAAKSLTELANNIPVKGGLAAIFTGEQSIVAFGSDLVSFGDKFRQYYDNISAVDNGKISNISTELNRIINWSTNVVNTDGKALDDFGNALKNFGENFAACAGNIIEGFTTELSNAYSTSKNSVVSWGTNVKEWFTGNSFGGANGNNFSNYATDIINGFKGKIDSHSGTSKSSMTTWANNIKNGFKEIVSSTAFSGYATDIINAFKNKINSDSGTSKSSIISWANNIKTWFKDIVTTTAFSGYAVDIINAFKNKVSGYSGTSKFSVTTWATNTKNWFKDIASSTAFGGFATDVVDGFKKRIDSYSYTAKSTMGVFAEDIKKRFNEKVSYTTFYDIGCDIIKGFNNSISDYSWTSKENISKWGEVLIGWFKKVFESDAQSNLFNSLGSFNGFNPTMSVSVDTSALKYYTSGSFAKSISSTMTTSTDITSTGYKEAMKEFYSECMETVIKQMAEDIKRQADKNEHTTVRIGNRVVTDAVNSQRQANGYRFTTT